MAKRGRAFPWFGVGSEAGGEQATVGTDGRGIYHPRLRSPAKGPAVPAAEAPTRVDGQCASQDYAAGKVRRRPQGVRPDDAGSVTASEFAFLALGAVLGLVSRRRPRRGLRGRSPHASGPRHRAGRCHPAPSRGHAFRRRLRHGDRPSRRAAVRPTGGSYGAADARRPAPERRTAVRSGPAAVRGRPDRSAPGRRHLDRPGVERWPRTARPTGQASRSRSGPATDPIMAALRMRAVTSLLTDERSPTVEPGRPRRPPGRSGSANAAEGAKSVRPRTAIALPDRPDEPDPVHASSMTVDENTTRRRRPDRSGRR